MLSTDLLDSSSTPDPYEPVCVVQSHLEPLRVPPGETDLL
jgi:hypothetical protein